jgi:murein DD-endopeptidase MepM/ murein hydrolase activator NlpD
LSSLLLATGCTVFSNGAPTLDPDAVRRQADRVVREARAEAGALRAEMAATRITAAKKEAEVQALQAELAELRHTLAARQQDLVILRSDREQLFASRTELQTQVAEIPLLRQQAAEAATTRVHLKELETGLAALTDELAQARQRTARRPAKSRPKPAPAAIIAAPFPAGPAPAEHEFDVTDASPTESPNLRVTVQSGDTLFAIATTHGLSVETLKQANGLSGTQIRVGQQLVLPPP